MKSTPPLTSVPAGPSAILKSFASCMLACVGSLIWLFPAHAHVKWFALYIVGAEPQPVGATGASARRPTGLSHRGGRHAFAYRIGHEDIARDRP